MYNLFIASLTMQQVQPVAGLVEHVRDWVPRIVVNRTRLPDISQEAQGNMRDVELIGNCDDCVLALAKSLGWEADLARLTSSFSGSTS